MGKKQGVLDISKIVGSPILIKPSLKDKDSQDQWFKNLEIVLKYQKNEETQNDEFQRALENALAPMWTGIVKSYKINQYLIPDENARNEFISLVREYEIVILEYISKFILQNGVLPFGIQTSDKAISDFEELIKRSQEEKVLGSRIQNLSKRIKACLNNPKSQIDMDLFWVMLCNDYEEILSKNPNIFKNIAIDAQKSLRDFYRTMVERPILFREVYVSKSNEYMVTSFPIEEQERRLLRSNNNSEKIVALVKSVLGKESVNVTEGMEVMETIFEALLLSDFYTIYPNRVYAQLAYKAVLKNYLLTIGFNKDEIEAMDPEELGETVSQTYDTTGLKHHKKLVAESIKQGIHYLDLDKLMLIVASRHLDGLENADFIYNKKSEEHEDSDSELAEHIIIQAYNDGGIAQMRNTEKIIREILRLKLISGSVKVSIMVQSEEYREFSKKTVEEMMEKFCDGIYLTETIEDDYITRAFFNSEGIVNWSDEFIQKVNFKERDIIVLSLVNFQNLKRLYENGKISKDNIMSILAIIENGTLEQTLLELREVPGREKQVQIMLENSSVFLRNLFDEKIITVSDLKSFYDKRIIKIDDLERLQEGKTQEEQIEFREQFGNEINNMDFLILYKEYIEHKMRYEKAVEENDPDVDIYKDTMEIKRKEKDNALMIFTKYKLGGLSDEEKENFIDDLLLTYCLELEHDNEQIIPETLRNMYKDGIIKFENISTLDQSYLQTVIIDLMFVRGELSLDDTRRLRETLSLEALTGILNKAMVNPSITQTQKVSLIMNIFHDGIEDEKRADKFLSQLHAKHYVGVKYTDLIFDGKHIEIPEEKPVDIPVDKTKPVSKKQYSKELVYPKYVKWKFLSALDKDAIVTVYANGYVEACSRKLGVRIVEKYFEVDRDGNSFGKSAYGHATFIVKESRYIENIERLVDNHSGGELLLNQRTLSSIVPTRDRVIHNTKSSSKNWMRSMAKYFDIDLENDLELVNDSRYTREELEYIRYVINTYENSYVDRNEVR